LARAIAIPSAGAHAIAAGLGLLIGWHIHHDAGHAIAAFALLDPLRVRV
jgi:hypothetical protein